MDPRILIVEDEPLIGWSLVSALRRAGYATDIVEGGDDALRKLDEGDYQLVISDIRLPEMDGIDLARRVKSASGNMPVIIVSTHEDLVRHEPEPLIDRYLEKPFLVPEMLSLVREVLDSAGATR